MGRDAADPHAAAPAPAVGRALTVLWRIVVIVFAGVLLAAAGWLLAPSAPPSAPARDRRPAERVLDEVPVPPAAESTATFSERGGILMRLAVQAGAGDTAAFYQAEMPRRGWMLRQGPEEIQSGLALSFGRKGRFCIIRIEPKDSYSCAVYVMVM